MLVLSPSIKKTIHWVTCFARNQLLQLAYVIFAGYKVPHPLEPRFIIKVQTDGTHTPIQAIQEAVKSLILTLDKMRNSLQNEFRVAKAVGVGQLSTEDGLGGLIGPAGGTGAYGGGYNSSMTYGAGTNQSTYGF
ncbi:hypothetical protein CROQUDRAFT_662013 [Cronartium quercuum f. sp. fusiforme G11]|uniref:DNA-directed RNA polymerase RBP11-like dimerisation domain-containing protein n=1 Tax=Cronartium quercuum f. sp. fusiforme G11 TaxID=708437 RepID=A0A9P6T8R3_9BASI|nr:hypothetical protein CROQUDRAFT_662013 [Cronartium quercuum f. sp. fusiforme G11]